jgi:hypothetical protein
VHLRKENTANVFPPRERMSFPDPLDCDEVKTVKRIPRKQDVSHAFVQLSMRLAEGSLRFTEATDKVDTRVMKNSESFRLYMLV